MEHKKTWFITGANRGLGLAMARSILEAGHTVIATSRNPAAIETALGTSDKLLCLHLDVTDVIQAKTAIATAIKKFGRIDVLINNAGYGQLGWFENTPDDQIQKQFETNVFGTMNITREVLPFMRVQQSGHIFTITSIAGFISSPGYSIYSSSKFALEGWMQGLAMELEPFNIKTTIIGPGYFNTDFLDGSSVFYSTSDIQDYAPQVEEFKNFNKDINHKQIGNANSLGKIVIKLSEEEKAPLRFSAGSDAYNAVSDKIAKLSREAETWKELSAASDNMPLL